MDGNYYIFTSTVFNTLDKTKIYSREYDINKENVALLATEPLTGFTQEFTSDTDINTYLTNQGTWHNANAELRFEDEYIPAIDDI